MKTHTLLWLGWPIWAILALPEFASLAQEGSPLVMISPTVPAIFEPARNFDAIRNQPMAAIPAEDTPVPPIVSLELLEGNAAETFIDQNAIIWGEFSVHRTGPTTNDLLVYFKAREGTAVFNVDYILDPFVSEGAGGTVRIPAGFASIHVRLYPIDDTLIEGPESAVIKVSLPPVANPLPPAYSIDEQNASVAITIFDNELVLPYVSLSAGNSWQTGEPCPFCRFAPALLTLTRTGSNTVPLSVFMNYEGTATAGVDSQTLPLVVTIPAGSNSTQIEVFAMDDLLAEGPEVIRARVLPMDTLSQRRGGYRIDPLENEALVVINDGEPDAPSLRLDLLEPSDGARFAAGDVIQLSALGDWTDAELDHAVEFMADGIVIGRSNPPILDRATIPGLPSVHTSFWTNPPSGEHVITARFEADATFAVTSPPVRITVAAESNVLPYVAIVRPRFGTAFPAGTPVEIAIETRDWDGYVPQVRFFADGRKLGEINVNLPRAPIPSQFQEFTFLWKDAAPGKHRLTAQVTDNQGGVGVSAAELIHITATNLVPLVTIVVRGAWAVEHDEDAQPNDATFRIQRVGPMNQPLMVAYALGGTAENGVDYEYLDGTAIIPAGSQSTRVTIQPRPDNLPEGLETVTLRLQRAEIAGAYAIGQPSVASVMISDERLSPPWPQSEVLSGHLIHLGFAAGPAQNFRLESSTDLLTWETIHAALSRDGSWNYAEGDADLHALRFYRLSPEPVVEPEE